MDSFTFRELKLELNIAKELKDYELCDKIRDLMRKKYIELQKKKKHRKTRKQNRYEYIQKEPIQNVQKEDTYDDLLKHEVIKDHINNNLMERMNSEIFIRKNKQTKKSFISPYVDIGNNLNDVYNPSIKNDDFRTNLY